VICFHPKETTKQVMRVGDIAPILQAILLLLLLNTARDLVTVLFYSVLLLLATAAAGCHHICVRQLDETQFMLLTITSYACITKRANATQLSVCVFLVVLLLLYHCKPCFHAAAVTSLLLQQQPRTIGQFVCECSCSQVLQLNACPHALLNTKRKDLTHCQHTHTMRTQHLQIMTYAADIDKRPPQQQQQQQQRDQ
jgi:hypothetical protein